MPDYDIREHARNKDLKGGIISAIVMALSLLIAFYWKDLFQEIVGRFFPHSIIAKLGFGVVLTVFSIYFSYYLMRINGVSK